MGGMQRALVLTAAAVVAVLCLAAAPALSLKPYRPEPVDFSMAGGGVLGTPGASDGVVSEPLRAPKRFNLVGLTWAEAAAEARDEPAHEGSPDPRSVAHEEPTLAVRTRADGGEWTAWKAVYTHVEDGPDPGSDEASAAGMSNPVWAGEADWVQYRSSERLPGARLHFVNTAGTATEADRARTAIRAAVSTAVASVAGVLRTRLAGAQEPQPAIVSRADWGAGACPPRGAAAYGQVKAAYVHHTVNLNDYTHEEAPQVVLGICRYHRNANGWNDIGYNFLVDRFGTIYEGRAGGVAAAVIGAQAEGFNAQSTGIANIGTFSSVPQSQAALDAMARLIRWKLPLHGYATSGTAVMQSAGGGTSRFAAGTSVRVDRVLGHRDTNATECPGAALYAQIPQLRQMAAGVAPQGVATAVTATVDAPRATIDYGASASVTGRLTRVDGAAAAGQPVQVQARIDGAWRTSSAPLTAADGSFAAIVKPKLTRQLRVRFAGAGELRSSVTPTTTVAVRPVVSLSRPPRRAAAGVRVDLRGRVQPRKARVHQVLQQLRGRRYRKVGAKALPTRRGGYFSGSFVPARPGVYRFYLATKADALNARGASDKLVVRVGERARALRGGARTR
jgi:N-acetylmuramoyl-L-alanine amidase